MLTLLAFLLAPVVFVAGTATALAVSLRRSNRVAPVSPVGGAPLSWLWSPGAAAVLHRRLRSACQLASSVAGPPGRKRLRRRKGGAVDSIAELAREVVGEAVRLDHLLVAANAGHRGMARAHALAALDYEVRAVEDAARRVHSLASRRAVIADGWGPSALSLNERIATLEAAFAELQARA